MKFRDDRRYPLGPRLAVPLWLVLVMLLFARYAPAQVDSNTPLEVDQIRQRHSPSTSDASQPASQTKRPSLPRLIRKFDFEDLPQVNFDDEQMPQFWYRVHEAGYPRYTRMGLDDSAAYADKHSLRLTLDGGSAGAMLAPGVIPVIANADYKITVRVRTDRLDQARARVIVLFLDAQNQPLSDAIVVSKPIQSPNQWSKVELHAYDAPAKAQWISIRLELVQQERYIPPAKRDPLKLMLEDIEADAWFDEVAVYQLPKIRLAAMAPMNMAFSDTPPALEATVLDIPGEPPPARLTLYNVDGEVVDQVDRDLSWLNRGKWQWQPQIEKFGWYRAQIELLGSTSSVTRAQTWFAWLPKMDGAGHGRERFALALYDWPVERRQALLQLLNHVEHRAVVIPVWRKNVPLDKGLTVNASTHALLADLLADGYDVSFSMAGVPSDLAEAAAVEPHQVLTLFTKDASLWQPALEALIARYGHRVSHWQFGSGRDAMTLAADVLAQSNRAIRGPFDQMMSEVVVEPVVRHVATDADQPLPQAMVVCEPRIWDDDTQTEHAEQGVSMIERPGPPWVTQSRVTAYFTGGMDVEHAAQRVTQMAQRMVRAWAGGADRMMLDRPWQMRSGLTAVGEEEEQKPLSIQPTIEFAVWQAMMQRLASRQWIQNLDIGPGMRCMLFDGDDQGLLVGWIVDEQLASGQYIAYLGSEARCTDLWGNPIDMTVTDQQHRWELSKRPTFIENANVPLARFRASLRLNPDFAESRYAIHRHALHMTNPWNVAITGQVRITARRGWKIAPTLSRFSIPAGGTYRIPLELTFPISETAGEKQLTCHVTLQADKPYRLTAEVPLRIGIRQFEFTAEAQVENRDVVVRLHVTNRSGAAQSLYTFTSAPPLPRQQQVIVQLNDDQTVVKEFRFNNAAGVLSGRSIRVGVRQMDGPSMINRLVTVP